jgi:hypothetical protein
MVDALQRLRSIGTAPRRSAYRRTRFACTPESECATDDLPKRVESTISNVSRRIEYVDLTPVFRAEAARGELIYRPDDIHWAPGSHRLAAEITMEVLASRTAADKR